MQIKRNDLQAFLQALWDEPINRVFAALNIISFMVAAIFVIDDYVEALAALLFVGLLFWGNYLIFTKQRATIAMLQHSLVDTAPEIVPMPIETIPSSNQPFILRIRNEGERPARNVGLRINYKDYIFSAEKGSIKPDEEISLELEGSLVNTPDSRIRAHRMMTSDETTILICEFSTPSGVNYVTRWECEWGKEWTRKKEKTT